MKLVPELPVYISLALTVYSLLAREQDVQVDLIHTGKRSVGGNGLEVSVRMSQATNGTKFADQLFDLSVTRIPLSVVCVVVKDISRGLR